MVDDDQIRPEVVEKRHLPEIETIVVLRVGYVVLFPQVKVVVIRFLAAIDGILRIGMQQRSVVRNEIQQHFEIQTVGFIYQLVQIFLGAVVRSKLEVVGDVVSLTAKRRLEHRLNPHCIYSKILDLGKP